MKKALLSICVILSILGCERIEDKTENMTNENNTNMPNRIEKINFVTQNGIPVFNTTISRYNNMLDTGDYFNTKVLNGYYLNSEQNVIFNKVFQLDNNADEKGKILLEKLNDIYNNSSIFRGITSAYVMLCALSHDNDLSNETATNAEKDYLKFIVPIKIVTKAKCATRYYPEHHTISVNSNFPFYGQMPQSGWKTLPYMN
jgi:hypothetical protein